MSQILSAMQWCCLEICIDVSKYFYNGSLILQQYTIIPYMSIYDIITYSYYLHMWQQSLWALSSHDKVLHLFLRATAVPAGTAEARISYGNSVCPSVTTRWYTKPIWDRDSGSSPYGSLESLVSYEVIWCQWVKRFPSNEGIKEGYPP